MEPISVVGTLIAGGFASLVMSWLEGRRLRKPRNEDAVIDDAASVAAISVAEGLSEKDGIAGAYNTPQDDAEVNPAQPAVAAPAPPSSQYVSDDERLIQVIKDRLSGDAQFRAALGLKKKTTAIWLTQAGVSAALLAVSIWAFATNTDTGVGFAFCGSLGGFWMREVAA